MTGLSRRAAFKVAAGATATAALAAGAALASTAAGDVSPVIARVAEAFRLYKRAHAAGRAQAIAASAAVAAGFPEDKPLRDLLAEPISPAEDLADVLAEAWEAARAVEIHPEMRARVDMGRRLRSEREAREAAAYAEAMAKWKEGDRRYRLSEHVAAGRAAWDDFDLAVGAAAGLRAETAADALALSLLANFAFVLGEETDAERLLAGVVDYAARAELLPGALPIAHPGRADALFGDPPPDDADDAEDVA